MTRCSCQNSSNCTHRLVNVIVYQSYYSNAYKKDLTFSKHLIGTYSVLGTFLRESISIPSKQRKCLLSWNSHSRLRVGQGQIINRYSDKKFQIVINAIIKIKQCVLIGRVTWGSILSQVARKHFLA